MTARFAGVVFDLDGVLVDSEPMHFRATNRMLARHQRAISEAEFQTFIGMGEEDTWRDWRVRFDLTAPLPQLYREIDQARLEEIARGVDPIAPAVALAKSLAAEGMALAIASASTQAVIAAVVEALGLAGVFRFQISGEDAAVPRSKPAPDIYLRAAQLLELAPASCVAIEDSNPGVRAAKAAGLFCVAVPTAWTKQQDFSAADLVLESLDEFRARVR